MKFKLNIKIGQSLTWLAVGISALLAVLLVEAVVLLSQLDQSQRRERELSTALTSVLEARSASTEAAMLLNELALTGDLESGAQASLLIEEARDAYRKGFPEDHQGVEGVLALMDEMLAAGNRMAKVYMLEGREAGNRLKADPEQGLDGKREAILDRMGAEVRDFSRRLESNRQEVQEAGAQARWVLISSTSLLLVVIPLAFFLLYRKVNGSIRHITGIVTVLGMGDFSARCRLKSGDELQLLADAFDRLLDERVEQMARSEHENNQINDSIINILEVTEKLSRHDLRVYAPVSEDITGAISDSINGAVADMAEVLAEVRRVAEEVRGASTTVDQQANKVYSAAESNLATVVGTLHDLQRASQSMEKVMSLAVMCHNVAGSATRSTGAGLESVTSSTEGMDRIRTSIQETSKRIKRLGERSQEISGIIGIIKDIAERTHVLALNARIQASTAGEAGKGFSVVADEVKQLAESSRNATGQIATLIQNIQVETADTIATMEQAVAEVVSGTELSERAKEQMLETRKTIARLAETVKQIAISTRSQVKLTREITTRADHLRESALNTQQEIAVQRLQSDRLNQSAARLTESVGQFVLPETA